MNEKLIEMLSKQIGAKLAGWDFKADKDSGTFKTVITSEVVDRDGEIIALNGWDFENYMKNPVVLRGHNYRDLPVGKCTGLSIEGGKVIATGEFASMAANPKAQQVRNLYDDGFINAVSVGFRVLQRNPANRTIIEKQELLEFSFVTVPANPEALGMGKGVKSYMETNILDANAKDGEDVHYVTYIMGKHDVPNDVTTDQTADDANGTTPPNETYTPPTADTTGGGADLEDVTLDKVYNAIVDLTNAIKSSKSVADDNADADFQAKEALQAVNRMTAEALRNIKLSK